MFTMFWDSQRVLLAHFQNRVENAKSAELEKDLLFNLMMG
jgi:hypothetical protein